MDRINIIAPDNLHDLLYAIPVIQSYQIGLVMGTIDQINQRKSNPRFLGHLLKGFQVMIRVKEDFKYLFPCLRIMRECNPEIDITYWTSLERDEYDCFIDFDFERAKAIALPTDRHIVDGLSILSGAGFKKWPSLAPLQLKKHTQEFSVGIYSKGWDGLRFASFITRDYPNVFVNLIEEESTDPEILIKFVANMDMIVGPNSLTTYVAAALKKSVIEFFDSKENAVLYNNLGLENYQSTIGDFDPAVTFTIWEDLYSRVGVPHEATSA